MISLLCGLFFSMVTVLEPETTERATQNNDPVHLFYFHGRIVEDGLPAISPQFGEYQYHDILSALDTQGIVLYAKQRGHEADIQAEAAEALAQIEALLAEGVTGDRIAIVGASKGSQIAALVSHELANQDTRLVILAGCWPRMVQDALRDQEYVYGDILEIRDIEDTGLEPGCGDLIEASPEVVKHKALLTELGVSHGLIYRPYSEWVAPTLDWVLAPAD